MYRREIRLPGSVDLHRIQISCQHISMPRRGRHCGPCRCSVDQRLNARSRSRWRCLKSRHAIRDSYRPCIQAPNHTLRSARKIHLAMLQRQSSTHLNLFDEGNCRRPVRIPRRHSPAVSVPQLKFPLSDRLPPKSSDPGSARHTALAETLDRRLGQVVRSAGHGQHDGSCRHRPAGSRQKISRANIRHAAST